MGDLEGTKCHAIKIVDDENLQTLLKIAKEYPGA